MKKEIARILLEVGCVKLSPLKPFTYASGLQGPIYCDNRKMLGHPKERNIIVDAFLNIIEKENFEYDHLAGLATGGIPYASFLALKKDEPMVYVRSKAKGHGKQGQIEGSWTSGDRFLIIEDLVNQGSSLKTALEGISVSGCKSVACISIVHYEMKAANNLMIDQKLPFFSLTDFSSLVNAAFKLNYISKEEQQLLFNWQQDPHGWRP